jgi:AcrR family transcriptional regulator
MNREAGLRERKKLAAMRRIQAVALDLFERDGFEKVTIEEIAAAAEVSASSVYRYFGTKEQLIIWDEGDLEFLDLVEEEMKTHPPVDAVRRVVTRVLSSYYEGNEELSKRKTRFFMSEPALQAVQLQQIDGFVQMVAMALARATGRDVRDLDVQVIASALLWALMAAVRHWYEHGYETPLADEMEHALTIVESGLRLE